jgi:hypothetical protein
VLRKDEKGNLHIKETADPGSDKGATFGRNTVQTADAHLGRV